MIKKAQIDDFEDVYLLINELEHNTIDKKNLYTTYCRQINNQDAYIYLYQDEHKVIALITMYVQHYLHHNHATGEIGELIVLDDYRGQKIGDQLINYIEDVAQDLHLEELSLSSGMWRKNAHRFYENHGYVKDHYSFEKKFNK